MQRRLTASLLAISLLPMTTGVVASATPQVAKAFPAANTTTLNLVVTMPSFAMVVLVIVSGGLVRHWGSKRLVLSGLGLVAMASLLAALAPNLGWLLVARLLLGVGLGLYNALAVSLISRLFQGATRQRLLGYQNAVQGLGALVGALAVAGLLILSWRAAFLIYLVSVPILLAYARNVPEVRFTTRQWAVTPITARQWRQIGYYTGLLFLLMTFYMLANLKLPALFVQRHLGSASSGALLLAVMAGGTVLAGISYQSLKRRWSAGVLAVSCALMLTGYGCLALPQRWGLLISAIVVGVSFGWFVPEIFGAVTKIVDQTQANLVTTILMTSSNLANFTASFALLLLAPTGHLNQLIWHSGFIIVGLGILELGHWWHGRTRLVTD
ncbi:MFS transporter [Lactiplantibacillus songbeiensis]|uniref:MFS transporter n=1 Tax=Lactiplantibacillus songbeiensis TaxID=2559920 RepID=A0ABW4BZM5_9LACO|nr:MFS transporter [Lactiplantibacillus songbeiensis]